uniref:ATP-binding cassette sub-family E member 1 (Trinotate prediction) n=1 Tax=Myxobolus squamalis TaxID=59785 RepID=A0A6B2G370_MYXSQ
MKKNGTVGSDKLTRIAIVSGERCRPKKCNLECKKNCPVVRQGKLCIEVKSDSKVSFISETLCIGCGICIKKCPLDAIKILNLPSSLEKDTTHRFGSNSFKLHRLPTPRIGEVLGLVGTNGIGKSTALKILSSKIKLNLGRFSNPPDWQEILTFFRGSELQNYFTKLLEDKISSIVKPQYIDQIPKLIKGSVIGFLKKKDQMNKLNQVIEDYELTKILDRDIEQLSGGELQRFACAITCLQINDIYMFDEPSSYLDVRQRLKIAENIRKMTQNDKYVIVVEHDLSVLDYLSDHICVLYGVPSAYGVVTLPFTVKEGINIFLDGFVPTENLRFRETSLTFKFMESVDTSSKGGTNSYSYPAMVKKFGSFLFDLLRKFRT